MEATATLSRTEAAAAVHAAWQLASSAPPDWARALGDCGGTVFHAPPALAVSLPPGEPVYARLLRGERTLAVALGVAVHCRLSRRARHLRFAALPAAAPGVDRGRAAARLVQVLAEGGAAEVAMDSFGAGGEAEGDRGGIPGRRRTEFVVPLAGGDDVLLAEMRATHRRHVRRGIRAGWHLRVERGDDALRLLAGVRESASGRAAARGDAFHAGPVPAAFGSAADRAAPWGVATFAAWDGGQPLAVAALGWAAGRAYYLTGGSTPDGYRQSAAHWLQWRMMADAASGGMVSYNLGGAAADAREPGHAAHGLYAYKSGFGGEEAACRGVRWEVDGWHLRFHRWLARMGGGR